MIKWNEVTWYSRFGALILFLVIVPILCFYIGTRYEEEKYIPIIDKLAESSERNLPIVQTTAWSPRLSDYIDAEGFYEPPYIPIVATREVTNLKPSGTDRTFTKEDAIFAAKYKGFFRGHREVDMTRLISLRTADRTGHGQAWFGNDIDEHASTGSCPPTSGGASNAIMATFEMNQSSGLMSISTKCSVVFIDF